MREHIQKGVGKTNFLWQSSEFIYIPSSNESCITVMKERCVCVSVGIDGKEAAIADEEGEKEVGIPGWEINSII